MHTRDSCAGIYAGNSSQSLICDQLGYAYDIHIACSLVALTGPRAARVQRGKGVVLGSRTHRQMSHTADKVTRLNSIKHALISESLSFA